MDESSFAGLLSCILCKNTSPSGKQVHYELYYIKSSLGKICYGRRLLYYMSIIEIQT